MRRLISVLAFMYLLGAVVGCAPAQKTSAPRGMPEGAPTKTIHVTAEKYKFTPNTIRVKKGTRLVLELESLDSRHEFELEEYGIHAEIPAGETVRVELFASEPGEFEFACHAGFGLHYKFGMSGTLIVEE
ncbi:MAG: cupredoxin domain-containing protein [Nitrospirota bacterium]|jgi:cytochrome c oxidase subunit 2